MNLSYELIKHFKIIVVSAISTAEGKNDSIHVVVVVVVVVVDYSVGICPTRRIRLSFVESAYSDLHNFRGLKWIPL